MSFNFFLGIALLVFGLMKAVLYFFGKRLALSRLESLKQKFGEQKGAWIYLLLYAAIPIGMGALLLLREQGLLD